ncbi:MAG: hypothetical protein Q9166_005308 [cf. Caloplaca sp. 2 TL-2023]
MSWLSGKPSVNRASSAQLDAQLDVPQKPGWAAPYADRLYYLRQDLNLSFAVIADVASKLRASNILENLVAGTTYDAHGKLLSARDYQLQKSFDALEEHPRESHDDARHDLRRRHQRVMKSQTKKVQKSQTKEKTTLVPAVAEGMSDYGEVRKQKTVPDLLVSAAKRNRGNCQRVSRHWRLNALQSY